MDSGVSRGGRTVRACSGRSTGLDRSEGEGRLESLSSAGVANDDALSMNM